MWWRFTATSAEELRRYLEQKGWKSLKLREKRGAKVAEDTAGPSRTEHQMTTEGKFRFEGVFVNEAGRDIKYWFEAPSQDSLLRHLQEKGWQIKSLRVRPLSPTFQASGSKEPQAGEQNVDRMWLGGTLVVGGLIGFVFEYLRSPRPYGRVAALLFGAILYGLVLLLRGYSNWARSRARK